MLKASDDIKDLLRLALAPRKIVVHEASLYDWLGR
jgi:hypothetical protein